MLKPLGDRVVLKIEEKEAGLEKMEQAIQVLSILDCKVSANYYKQGMQELIKEA